MLDNVADYRAYLDTIGGLLGPIREGLILDAGCGAVFGVWVLRDLLAREPARWERPPSYLGIDLTLDGLRDAWEQQVALAQRLGRRALSGAGPMQRLPGWTWMSGRAPRRRRTGDVRRRLFRQDLLQPGDLLPAPAGGAAARAAARAEARGAAGAVEHEAVLRHVRHLPRLHEATEPPAWNWSPAATCSGRQIKRKEEMGDYAFYFEQELRAAAVQAGFTPGRWQNCFGNQAVALAARK